MINQIKTAKTDNKFLLILDYDLKHVQALKFIASDAAVVTELYNKVETQIALNPNSRQNAVLVSADSFNDLIKGYPNYFADIRDFIGSLTYALDRTAKTNK